MLKLLIDFFFFFNNIAPGEPTRMEPVNTICQNSIIFTKDTCTQSSHNAQKYTVYLKLISLGCTSYGFGQTDNDMHPLF